MEEKETTFKPILPEEMGQKIVAMYPKSRTVGVKFGTFSAPSTRR